MNINICRFHCGKCYHPEKIFRMQDGEWYLAMEGSYHRMCNAGEESCSYLEIEDASDLLEHPPKGWCRFHDELFFEEGNAESVLWRIHLKGGESRCRFMAEHMMYDMEHEKRLADWKLHDAERKRLIDERIKNGH